MTKTIREKRKLATTVLPYIEEIIDQGVPFEFKSKLVSLLHAIDRPKFSDETRTHARHLRSRLA